MRLTRLRLKPAARITGKCIALLAALSGCTGIAPHDKNAKLVQGPPIADVQTPFDQALTCLNGKISPRLRFAVGIIPDLTGREQYNDGGAGKFVSQGAGAYAQPFNSGGFDSVNQDFEDIVADINDEFATGSARFANIAINTGDVDASVTINANLDEGGEFSSFRSTFFDKDFESTGADISDGAATMEMSMGSISTLAAGALNTVTMDLTEAAAASSFDVASGSVAAAGSTVSASAYDRGVTPGRRIAPCGGVRMEVLAGSDTRHDTTPAHPPRGKRT